MRFATMLFADKIDPFASQLATIQPKGFDAAGFISESSAWLS